MRLTCRGLSDMRISCGKGIDDKKEKEDTPVDSSAFDCNAIEMGVLGISMLSLCMLGIGS